MKIFSWNVNGIRSVWKKNFKKIVLKEKPDVLLLQEIKVDKEIIKNGNFKIGGYKFYSNSAKQKGYSGVGIYTKIKPLNVITQIDNQDFDQEGRIIALEFDKYFLVNIYLPHSGRKLQNIDKKILFDNLFDEFCIKLRKNKPIIIGGDFNVAHKEIDIANPKQNKNNAGFTQKERKWFDKFLKNDQIDTFRKFNKKPDNYTWWTYRFNARKRNIGWRIDYFIISKKLCSKLKDAFIMPKTMGSDHCPIGIEINI